MATEFVGIELQLRGADGVRKDLTELDRLLNSLGGRKKVGAGMDELRKDMVAARGELEKYIRLREKYLNAGGKGDAYVKEIQNARNELKDLQQVQREVTASTKALGKTFTQTFNSWSSKIAHAGSAMQSLGNALTRLSSPFRRFTSGLLMGAGYKALNLFTEGFSGTFERADVMKNYPRTIAKLFKDDADAAAKAEVAIKDMETAVLGLPTGLDEIVAVQKRFVSASQDMEKSTGLAIAFNNAILASGADSRQAYTAQRLFTQLAGGAELTTNQWQALQKAIPLAFTELANQAEMSVGDYVKAVSNGTIATEDFMNTFIEAGRSGTIADMARVMTKSWEGLSANIQNAAKRMGTAVLDTLHEVFKKETGRDFLDILLGIDANGERTYDGIRDFIDDISASVQNWIKAHPKELIDFFNTIKSIDWASVARGFAEGTLAIAQFVANLAKLGAGKDLSWIGRFMTKASVWGKGFTIFGGVLKGLRHPLALLATLAERHGKTGGLLGLLAKLFGKGKDAKAAESVLGEAPTFASTAKRAFSAIQGVISVAAAIAIGSGAGFIAFKSFKSMMGDLRDIIDIMSDIDWELGAGALTAMGTFFAAFAGLGKFASMNVGNIVDILIGEAGVGLITTLAAGFAKVDLWLFKSSMLDLEGAIDALSRTTEKIKSFGSIPAGAASRIGDAVIQFNRIIDLFNGKRNVSTKQMEGGLKGFSGAKTKTVKNIKTTLDALLDSAKAINKINSITLDTSNIESLTEDFNTALQAIGGIFSRDNLPEAFYYGEGAGASTDFASTLGNINNALGYLVGENGVLAKLRQLGSETNVSVSSQMAKGNISEMLNNLKTAFSGLVTKDAGGDYSSVATKMSNFATALESVRVAFKKMAKIEKLYDKLGTNGSNGIGNFKATSAINSLISQLQQAFEANKINTLNSQITGFVDTVNSLLDQVNKINTDSGDITIEIKLKDKITGDDKVVRDIKNVDSKIKRAINSIQTSYTKTIRVNIGMRGIVSGASAVRQAALDAVNSVNQAKGGMIYRSRGGSIPFKRRGTDTVPAMLTPGEYVHNKRAVSTFGIDFMRKVNNLDIKGAMSELMHRAGSMANVNRGTNITHNYYNNQRVNQTINTNSPDFATRVASRFVGAF